MSLPVLRWLCMHALIQVSTLSATSEDNPMQPLLPRGGRKNDSWRSLSSESGLERTVGLSVGSYVVPEVVEQGLG